MPATIVVEVCYMIGRYRFGAVAEAAFLRSLASRVAQLMQQYEDFLLRWIGRKPPRDRRATVDHDHP